MIRIRPINRTTVHPATAELLGAVQRRMGAVPNLIATMAHSPAVAKAYLASSEVLSTGLLPRRVQEQIALVVGETNDCGYCVAAHLAFGKGADLSEQEARDARRAIARDEKERVALAFARRIVETRGGVADADVECLYQAGWSDGEVCELVANVVLNIFSNYFNRVAGIELDAPPAASLAA